MESRSVTIPYSVIPYWSRSKTVSCHLAPEWQVNVPETNRFAANHGSDRLLRSCGVRLLQGSWPDLLADWKWWWHRDKLVDFHVRGKWHQYFISLKDLPLWEGVNVIFQCCTLFWFRQKKYSLKLGRRINCKLLDFARVNKDESSAKAFE